MQKTAISFIIALSIIIGAAAPAFAISTDSAIKSNDLRLGEIKATGDTVNPVSASGTVYSYSGGTSIGSTSQYVDDFADLITGITRSIANSFQAFANKIVPYIDGIEGYVDNLETLVSGASTTLSNNLPYIYDRLGVILGAVDQLEGYVDGIETLIGTTNSTLSTISTRVNTTNTRLTTTNSHLSNISNDVHSIVENFTSEGAINVNVVDNPTNGFNQNDFWKKYDSIDGNVINYRTLQDGTSNSATWSLRNHSAFESMEYFMMYYLTSFYNYTSIFGKNWQNANGYLYKPDLTTTALGTSGNSFWYDFRRFASNTSQHLARLDYVLASDEEIAARAAASANQDEVVDDFISSSGSGSAKASDFADIANVGGTFKNALDSNVSAGTAFNSLSSNSQAWDWFSQTTADSLDSTQQTRSGGNSTPYLDNYYRELMEEVTFK